MKVRWGWKVLVQVFHQVGSLKNLEAVRAENLEAVRAENLEAVSLGEG